MEAGSSVQRPRLLYRGGFDGRTRLPISVASRI